MDRDLQELAARGRQADARREQMRSRTTDAKRRAKRVKKDRLLTRSLGGDMEGFRTAGIWVSLVLFVGIAVLPWLPETRDQPLPED